MQKIEFQSLCYIGFLSFRGWTIRGLRGCGIRDPGTRLARDVTGQCLHLRFEECIALFFEALEQRQAIFHVTFVQVLEVLRIPYENWQVSHSSVYTFRVISAMRSGIILDFSPHSYKHIYVWSRKVLCGVRP